MLYIDKRDDGLSPLTSHPRFVSLAPEGFYDEGNEFAPFGSDDGHDVLRDLEVWYEAKGPDAEPAAFLAELLDGWGFNLPEGVADYPDGDLIAWIGQRDRNEVFLSSEARARIAGALGQLKIVGVISPAMQAEGQRGLRVLRLVMGDTGRYPDWPHRAEALRALDDIEKVLTSASG